ncbi:hypothetical protein [Scytonema millei]|uniref:Uncharacterized protein n=1 Tax=Scytonema millei VB511283 TaxID=1245923 RepID=A0A9X5E3X3_9CYAN|nr:hypothetical protein [Scytonema millei]NHC34689.1 hypothetical protein [Scytonema millei VB511283]
MSSDAFLKNLLSQKNNTKQIIVSEAKHNNIKTDNVAINHPSEVSLAIVFFSGLVCFLMYSKRWRTTRENVEDLSEITSSHIPCKRCRFFSNNPYLKCAVQPIITMTKEAIDCAEFRPKIT